MSFRRRRPERGRGIVQMGLDPDSTYYDIDGERYQLATHVPYSGEERRISHGNGEEEENDRKSLEVKTVSCRPGGMPQAQMLHVQSAANVTSAHLDVASTSSTLRDTNNFRFNQQINRTALTMSYYMGDDEVGMYHRAMMARGQRPRRFDEYYRCYPIAMMPGPEREAPNHGGKIFLPASALDKLTQLHITYPMLFELTNGAKEKKTHAGVLEFTAEEGRCYLPFWLMQTLQLEPGDLLQTKSTDLPPGSFIKLQAQSTNFLDISDPKAVLENAFRNFSCLTLGDVFTFSYNDTIYEIAVLEVKPDMASSHAISVQETDLEVDFAAPVGYEEPSRTNTTRGASGTSTPRSITSNMAAKGGVLHAEGTMAQAINYSSIAPSSSAAAVGAQNASSHFSGSGNRLVPKKGKGSNVPTPATSTPGTSTPIPGMQRTSVRNRDGPQPLRLPPNKLFFGYEVKPVKSKEEREGDGGDEKKNFGGEGQTLRKKK